MIEAINISFAIERRTLLHSFSHVFEPGKCYMVCGPNGAGKSTLLKLLSLEFPSEKGCIKYNGKLANYHQRSSYATERAVLSQQIELAFPLQVYDVVMMGRYPYFTSQPSSRDMHIVSEALRWMEVDHLQQRNFLTLSGGEKQRVHFARVLAQVWEPPATGNRLLLLDEPVSFLDLRHQVHLLQQIRQITNEHTVVILIMHDLNLVLNFADEVLLLGEGKLQISGTPTEVLTPANIEAVFGQPVRIMQQGNHRWIWPVL